MFKKLKTPHEIDSNIINLCKKIGNVEKPIFVDVKPRSDSIVNECYIDTKNQVNEFGGEIQYGWMVWILENAYLEATFHAVWKVPEGKLLDTTVKEDNENRILFIPDNSRKFNDSLVPSVRLALATDPLIFKWIEFQNQKEVILSEKTKGDNFSSYSLNKKEYEIFKTAELLNKQVTIKYALG